MTSLILNIAMATTLKGFTYKYENVNFTIRAPDLKTAAKACFNKLTNGKYPGEERGLEIIDACANPKETK